MVIKKIGGGRNSCPTVEVVNCFNGFVGFRYRALLVLTDGEEALSQRAAFRLTLNDVESMKHPQNHPPAKSGFAQGSQPRASSIQSDQTLSDLHKTVCIKKARLRGLIRCYS